MDILKDIVSFWRIPNIEEDYPHSVSHDFLPRGWGDYAHTRGEILARIVTHLRPSNRSTPTPYERRV